MDYIVKNRILIGAAGLLLMCLALSMCSISSKAWQDTNISVSGNDSDQSLVPPGNDGLVSISGGDIMASDAMDVEKSSPGLDLGEQILASLDSEADTIINLQVPNNLDFVIDPWNISGKGQIYSERFTIVNCGDTTCNIQLQDISCTDLRGVTIMEDAGQVYMQDEAGIYLELVFGNGETRALTEEGQEYTAILKPNEELAFWLTGTVNEKTSKGWEDKTLSVKLKYFSTLHQGNAD